MKLEQSFEVAAPLERVWEALIDVERVAPCLPGASVTGRNDDGSYNGNFKVKIGPTSAAYTGKLMMEDVDESAHRATMQASGTDRRGQGGAKATIVSSVREGEKGAESTLVEVVTDYHITGRLARFGRGGMIEDISNRLLGEFAKCLQTNLAGPGTQTGNGAASTAPSTTADAAQDATTPAATGATPDSAPPAPADPAPESASAAEPEPAQAASTPSAAESAATAPAAAASDGAPSDGAPSAFTPPQMTEAEPVEGLSLMASVLFKQAKRNPAPIAALIVGFLIALRVFRRRD